jgi:hypothetical protein
MPKGFVSFADVKRAVSFEAVLLRYGLLEGLSRKGANLAGPCPFCEAASSRHFQVNIVKNAWYCFGCKEGGNVLDFVAKREGVRVRDAALLLDRWFDLGLLAEKPPKAAVVEGTPNDDPREPQEAPTANPPLTFALKTLDAAHPSLKVLGLSASTIESFGLGYCTKGLQKGRIAIPIRNASGDLVAYAGLLAEGRERYLFPPNFHQALEVFNIHRLAETDRDDLPLHLVPEILDVLRLADFGVPRVLGLFDGSLSEGQEEAIRGLVSPRGTLILVGDGFPERTVARLARLASISWVTSLPSGDDALSGEACPEAEVA